MAPRTPGRPAPVQPTARWLRAKEVCATRAPLPAALPRRASVCGMPGRFYLIDKTGQHLDAERLFQLAKEQDPKINRVTVYRTLKMLKEV